MNDRTKIRAEYTLRFERHRKAVEKLAEEDARLSQQRLMIFGIFLAVMGAALYLEGFSGWIGVAPLSLFLLLVVRHDRVLRKKEAAERAASLYQDGIRRLNDEWMGHGSRGEQFFSAEHPYAIDLDLFGQGSLFELLSAARTPMGESRLAEWLLSSSSPSQIRARQQAVEELRPRIELREEFALLGEEVRPVVRPDGLLSWASELPVLTRGSLIVGVNGLTALFLLSVVAMRFGLPPALSLGAFLIQQIFNGLHASNVSRVIRDVNKPARDLFLFAALLERLEQESFSSPLLLELRSRLETNGDPPSAQIRKLHRYIDRLNSISSPIMAILGIMLLLPTRLAIGLEQWRIENGSKLGDWLEVIGEFEALSSLARFAAENPGYPFPEIEDDRPALELEGVAHPLIPQKTAVANDLQFGADRRMYVISGSNMSGKSTLMRSVGVNIVLALAGAPVRATRMKVGILQIGASIRTQDSLQEGISRFYAEILRLRQISEISRTSPNLFFLLDEILHGTNSHDRKIGAEGVIRALAAQGAQGLVTTHDLALAEIANDPALLAANVHLEDHLEDGKMRFDYLLRPGVVRKSNALELMRAVGLDV